MNIWTAFFMVVSVVILASPFLSLPEAAWSGSVSKSIDNGAADWDANEIELDLASGRLAREDYEAMAGGREQPPPGRSERAEGEDGTVS